MDLNPIEILEQTEQLANESPEQRLDRLEALSRETGVDQVTLYESEQALRGFGREAYWNSPEQVDTLVSQAKAVAPMVLGPEADVSHLDATTLVDLFAMQMLEDPRAIAETTLVLYRLFDQIGLYERVGHDADDTVARVLEHVDDGV